MNIIRDESTVSKWADTINNHHFIKSAIVDLNVSDHMVIVDSHVFARTEPHLTVQQAKHIEGQS
ncbi:MAG: hypothetical protein C4542_04290 [Dehalococcoidia bacterium]|nr:MAG: hypothetical protein C4542_04290 [Dehalococcoidia bacterium]